MNERCVVFSFCLLCRVCIGADASPELGTKQRKREDRVAATFDVDCFFFFNAQ